MPFNYFAHNLTLMGTIRSIDAEKFCFSMRLQNGQDQEVFVSPTTVFQVIRNLDNLDLDRVPDPQPAGPAEDRRSFCTRKYITQNSLIATHGVYQEHEGRSRFEARTIYLMHSRPEQYQFEEKQWWITQISRLADQWLDQLFGDRRDYTFADFVKLYATNLNIIGMPTDETTQEMATLSRLLYGLSSAYLLTGSERYLAGARAGVQFQRETFRHLSHDGLYCFWAFGRKRLRYITQIYDASQSGDDVNTVPLYEQIYALAGLTQYYRITLDWRVLEDIRRTVRAFNDFYLDGRTTDRKNPHPKGPDGYFSHLDYATMRPDDEKLGINRAKKNWNSIGDHLPAYLINLVLALDPLPQGRNTDDLQEFLEKCKWMLEHTTDLICEHFPDLTSKYVNERFSSDWTPDHVYSWQQNRGIVGHNLKIAWNLTRMANYFSLLARSDDDAAGYRTKAARCMEVATKLGDDMAFLGVDLIRGGCFDAVERNPSNGMPMEFAWSSTKDFWQQEQGILAYLILYGATQKDEYKKLARHMLAFWNIFFLDHDYNGIYFRVSDDGIPITTGNYGIKGGHSVSGYHAFELNFLAHLYIRSFVSISEASQHEFNFVLYFKPDKDCGQTSVNVLPDFFPPGLVRLKSVTVGGLSRSGAMPKDFQVRLSPEELGSMVCVEFESRRHPNGALETAERQGNGKDHD